MKEVNTPFVFDGECLKALEPVQWNHASAGVDLGNTELFHVAVVTSVSL